MDFPSFIGSRADWDLEQHHQLRAAFRDDEDGFQRAWARRYPVTVESAIAELRHRGFNVNEDSFPQFCNLDALQRIGRNYVFYPEDIDEIAEVLVEAEKFSGLALRRKNAGISYSEELEGIRHVLDTRRRKAAEAIGVSVEELTAAIRCGGISDPAYKPIDLVEAKACFSANQDNVEFQQQMQEVL